jgi:hypothetical protein
VYASGESINKYCTEGLQEGLPSVRSYVHVLSYFLLIYFVRKVLSYFIYLYVYCRALLWSYCAFSNQGGIVHPHTKIKFFLCKVLLLVFGKVSPWKSESESLEKWGFWA